MVPRFFGLAQFEKNCKIPDPQNLVHLSRGLLVKTLDQMQLHDTRLGSRGRPSLSQISCGFPTARLTDWPLTH